MNNRQLMEQKKLQEMLKYQVQPAQWGTIATPLPGNAFYYTTMTTTTTAAGVPWVVFNGTVTIP